MIEMNLPDGRTYIEDLINQVPHGNSKFIVRWSGVVQGQFNKGKPWNAKDYDINGQIKGEYILDKY